MKSYFGKKQISIGLMILIFICLIYAVNSKNQAAIIVTGSILILFNVLETVWTIMDREYKTTYWIALANIINIICILSLMVLLMDGKNVIGAKQIANHIMQQDGLGLGFYLSLLGSSLLRSEMFKIDKGLLDDESKGL